MVNRRLARFAAAGRFAMGRGLAALADGLFPQRCALCDLPSGRELPLCRPCEGDLSPNRHACRRCAIPLAPAATADQCGACLAAPPPFQRTRAPWLYDDALAHLIQRWKYRGEELLTPMLAALWLSRVEAAPAVDLLVPVPLHWRRHWRRGYNQAELLARRLLAAGNLPADCRLAPGLVRRRRATAAQAGMDRRQRGRNLRAAFTVRQPCDNLRIALVDDVMTTGATAAELAHTLLDAGAGPIEVWCLARTPAPGN